MLVELILQSDQTSQAIIKDDDDVLGVSKL